MSFPLKLNFGVLEHKFEEEQKEKIFTKVQKIRKNLSKS